jgi:hypothetical protein
MNKLAMAPLSILPKAMNKLAMAPFSFLDTFAVRVPRGWSAIPDEAEDYKLPYALGRRRSGVGALTFSIGFYGGGPIAGPSVDDLDKIVERFGAARGLGRPTAKVAEAGPPLLAAGSFKWKRSFLRVWHLSDGCNFALAAYNCDLGQQAKELPNFERIVRSISFAPVIGSSA